MENKIEQKILELFLFNNKLKFSEIEKYIKIRSNKLTYHLKSLIRKEILVKNNENYSLSETAEHLIPYLSDKKAVLPVILIHIGDKNQCFLYTRDKRPFKNYLSLPGGRLLINESIEEATKRLMKKFSINAKLKKINSISLEHVESQSSNNRVHSFLLIFVSGETKDNLVLTNIRKNKSKIINSDFQLLKNNLNKKIKINTLYSES
jgi:ADP-ribose pyrophosphatase YjhB (NUDIX family)